MSAGRWGALLRFLTGTGRLARANVATSDSGIEYERRRLSLGMRDGDPRSADEFERETAIDAEFERARDGEYSGALEVVGGVGPAFTFDIKINGKPVRTTDGKFTARFHADGSFDVIDPPQTVDTTERECTAPPRLSEGDAWRKAVAEPTWPRPIADAPRDGSRVLVWVPPESPYGGEWDTAYFSGDYTEWQLDNGLPVEPTHYVPLPEAPK